MIFGGGRNFLLFLNFIKYFLNKLTPYTQENGLQLFSILNLAIHVYDFRGWEEFLLFFLNFIKYFLNKLTPYTQENGLQLFSILNLAIHGYDFRGWGRIFYFFFILSLVFGETDIVTSCVYSILEGIVGCGVGMTTYESNPCFIL